MKVLGFTINQLSLFGMVLAIGIVVDDAIVVIENVERIMTEEGLSPRDATIKAMHQISGAVIAITIVLAAVFVPSALQAGSAGAVYKQFALTIAMAMLFFGVPRTRLHAGAVREPAQAQRAPRQPQSGLPRVQQIYGRLATTYVGHVGRACGMRRAG